MPSVPTIDVDLAVEPGLGDGAAAAGAERAGAVRLVDDHAGVVAAGELDDLGQRGDVAVHREHAVGDDQRAAPLGLAQAPREVVDVAVLVDEGLGPGRRQPSMIEAWLSSSENTTSPRPRQRR